MGTQASSASALAGEGRWPDPELPGLGPAVLPRWILVWFAVSVPLILWDVSFVLFRPGWFLWAPYDKYVTVDLSYGDPGNGFVRAQAIMSLLEIAVVVVALWLRRRPLGVLLVFGVSLLTAAKTMLILLIEVVTGGAHVGHNPAADLVLLYLVPNGVWIVVPLLVAKSAGRTLLSACHRAPSSAPRGRASSS